MVQFNSSTPSRGASSASTNATRIFFLTAFFTSALGLFATLRLLHNLEVSTSQKSNNDQGGSARTTRQAKWKLWHEMTPFEQKSELERVFSRAAPYGKMLGGEKDTSKFHNTCPSSGEKPMLLGKGGEHMVGFSYSCSHFVTMTIRASSESFSLADLFDNVALIITLGMRPAPTQRLRVQVFQFWNSRRSILGY